MSRKKCCKCKCCKCKCCKCKCKHGKCKCKKQDCCCVGNSFSGVNNCSGFDPCTVLPTLLVLQSSGLLCNDRAFILFLLFLLCGGTNNTNSCGCNCC
ncbi:hypothetical protein [Clostridium sp. LIBA-8841]|uniref:hypothetical protein n=1 Tax=Clostridium sp. LIBA-8841 TaxID=2987530 RepID=UPI002AC71D96|nr:hypothetical protein [Clostridium sp. LIBA-8841]MDZ5252283.1 hypothetical protein [Clostridium sp. LIBA-8841]